MNKMKKTLALLLALCMLLAAIPAMAEDASGHWYVVMVGLTAADIELNADGTCALIAYSEDEEAQGEGTWTQEGDKITVDMNDSTLPLIYDGESLQFDAEGLAALGLDSSDMVSGGVDLSTLIQISREPGLVTSAEFNAYQEDGTLPEGKTEEDMEAIQAEMMLTFLSLMGSADMGDGTESSTGEGEAPELTIVEDNFYVREGYGSQEGYYLAKVQNENAEPVYLSSGTLTLLDAEGNEVGQSDYLSANGSTYLEPGEITFVALVADVAEGAEVDHYTVQLAPTAISYQTPDTILEVSDAELRVEEGYFTSYYAATTITNGSENPQARIYAIAAVRDAEGKLMGLASTGLYMHELAAGSTITLVDNLDSRVTDYCEQNGLTLSQVEAYAWISAY